MVPTGATDARTAKVIQPLCHPNPVGANTVDVGPGTGRNLAERRHPESADRTSQHRQVRNAACQRHTDHR